MLERIRPHLTYANMMSTVAAFAALGGGVAWALEANSVRSKHIVNGQVKKRDVRENSLDATHLKEVDELSGSGLRLVNVPPLQSSAYVALIGTEEFTVFGECLKSFDDIAANLKVQGDKNLWSFDSDGSNGSTDNTGLPTNAWQTIVGVGPTTGSHFFTGNFTAAQGTEALSGIGSAGTEVTGFDCAFGLSALR